MNNIRIHLSDSERACQVDDAELQLWGKALIEKILFESAKSVSADRVHGPIGSTVSFRVGVDSEDGSILIEV